MYKDYGVFKLGKHRNTMIVKDDMLSQDAQLIKKNDEKYLNCLNSVNFVIHC